MRQNDPGEIQVARLETQGIRAPQNDANNLDAYRMPAEKTPAEQSEKPSHIASTIEMLKSLCLNTRIL